MATVYFGTFAGGGDDGNWNTSIQFTVTGTPACSPGDTYSNNGITFTITSVAAGVLKAGGSGTSEASGTLTRVSGGGPATIAFSAKADINWFSDPGFESSSSSIPPTPLGRVPTTDDLCVIYGRVFTAPVTQPWLPKIIISGSNSVQNAGVFAGRWREMEKHWNYPVWDTYAGKFEIVGGDGDGALAVIMMMMQISLPPDTTINASQIIVQGGTLLIYGGTTINANIEFTKTGLGSTAAVSVWTGTGTYSPVATINSKADIASQMPTDYGLKSFGWTFSPRLTFAGDFDILGAGMW